MQLFFFKEVSNHEWHLIDPEQNPEVDYLNFEPSVAGGLRCSAGLAIFAAYNYHDVDENCDSVQCIYCRYVPDLHQVYANENNNQQNSRADPLSDVENPTEVNSHIEHMGGILTGHLCAVTFSQASSKSGDVGVKIASTNGHNELNTVVEADDQSEQSELLVHEDGHVGRVQVVLLLEYFGFFSDLVDVRCAVIALRVVRLHIKLIINLNLSS